jgi:phospholipase/carboxylesterase
MTKNDGTSNSNAEPEAERAAREGRLLARPSIAADNLQDEPRGLQKLGIDKTRDGLLFVPSSYRADQPMPLLVMLHGAGGNAGQGLDLMQQVAEREGYLLLATDSRGQTWDMILDDYGPDVAFLDSALQSVFERFAVDASRVAIGGFSDGASYALSLGLSNGELFSHIIAFSPGYMSPAEQRGKPRIFISHGTDDRVLPIDRCSRRIAPQLKRAGYDVQYLEFNGPHAVPPVIRDKAAQWFDAAPDNDQVHAPPLLSYLRALMYYSTLDDSSLSRKRKAS